MGADADLIARQPKGSFATFIRGLTDRAVPMSFPFFTLEALPRTSRDEKHAIRDASRARYADAWREEAKAAEAGAGRPEAAEPGGDDEDPLAPSDEL